MDASPWRSYVAGISVALLLALNVGATDISSPLPNDCVIVAIEAHARLFMAFILWVDVLNLEGTYPNKGKFGHTVCVFQENEDGLIHLYDSNGTVTLNTTSRKASDIAREIEKTYKVKVTKAWFDR